jgi:hypothetical protein
MGLSKMRQIAAVSRAATGGAARGLVIGLLLSPASPAWGGPPYLTDDPEPTDFRHFEIYAYGAGTLVPGGADSETGIDFNYGGAPGLQLTATLPLLIDRSGDSGIGNIALGVKYRFLTQDASGLDVAFFPHLVLSSASAALGDHHMSLFLPLWVQKDFGDGWSAFGGGGCTLNHSRFSSDFCEGGLVLTREVAEGLTLGAEVFHSGSEEPGGRAETALGAGLTWDLDATHHLLAYWGPNIQHPIANGRSNFYTALLFTF